MRASSRGASRCKPRYQYTWTNCWKSLGLPRFEQSVWMRTWPWTEKVKNMQKNCGSQLFEFWMGLYRWAEGSVVRHHRGQWFNSCAKRSQDCWLSVTLGAWITRHDHFMRTTRTLLDIHSLSCPKIYFPMPSGQYKRKQMPWFSLQGPNILLIRVRHMLRLRLVIVELLLLSCC